MNILIFLIFVFSSVHSDNYLINNNLKDYVIQEEYLENIRFSEQFKRDYIAISLGSGCGVAMYLRHFGLSEYSFPLNWVITPLRSLFLVIENDFKDYFIRSHLLVKDPGHPGNVGVYDTFYNIHSRHDFLANKDFWSQYDFIKSKYDRRVKRFYDALSSGKKIYFIRHDIDKENSLLLYNLISKKFPKLNFILIAIEKDSKNASPWNLKNIKNYFINDHDAMYNPNSWRNIFQDSGLI